MTDRDDSATAPRPTAQWRVKYDGACSRCGKALRAGDVAVYERPSHSIRCVVCPPSPDTTAERVDFDTGVAGRSAGREHERRQANREARVKDRFGRRLGGAILAVTDEPQSTQAWAKGARGEQKLAKALEGIEDVWTLHDRRVPGTRANIDHVLIGPAGVFVIDAKNYQGKIEIRNRGWFLRPDHRLYVGRRDCSDLAAGLGWQVEAVTAALTAAGVDPIPSVTPVLCFVDGEWPLFSPPNAYSGVRLESTRSIRKLVGSPDLLDRAAVERLARILGHALPSR
jgi:Nuclease-related domain